MGLDTLFLLVFRGAELTVALLWPLSVGWVALDVGRRTRHRGQRRLAIGSAVLLPYVGALLYRVLRPPEYLHERRLREVEQKLVGARERRGSRCPSCGAGVEPDFLSCAGCGARLREPCDTCGRPLDLLWACCPWCERDAAPRSAAAVAPSVRSGATARASAA